ncbi:hypothetical protein EJC49_03235 [Aquibium carbonis]|uniref:NYN domain-containing protein n=1 Tax=Aquibium carbonis TaxID=2495581 RepID=A0A3S0ABC8_9HYPH|nr:hypothetical protein [Aquibium carbonis]RST87911.1 hypothetical protein EJC49_03235 [Aquibium carbonis]
MIERPEGADRRTLRFLIMDSTPLSLLGCIGALDWLFLPGCPVMITDMVVTEVLREPGEGKDQRRGARDDIRAWMDRNRDRLTILVTPEGVRYEREMKLWELASKPEFLMPSWSDRGERSLLSAVQDLKQALARGEEIVVIVDDRDARDAVRAVRADLTMMGTRTFIRWMDEDFGAPGADTAWHAIRIATARKADDGDPEDPVFIRPWSV